MKKLAICTSLLCSSLIQIATAEEFKNYLSISGGIAFPSDVEADAHLGGTAYDLKFESNNPAFFSVGLGRKFNDFRLEFNYSKATLKTKNFKAWRGIHSVNTGVSASITPELESDVSSYMIYGYKDFSNASKFTPYAGIGVGFGSFSAKDQTATIAGTAYKFEGGNETVFSPGVKAGLSYKISDNTSLFSEGHYQYFLAYDISEPGFETVNYDANHFLAVTAGLKFSF